MCQTRIPGKVDVRVMEPPIPEIQESSRVRHREEDDDQHVRPTRRFRWWQENQENQLQEMVNELTTSNHALGYWYTMSTRRDLDDPRRSEFIRSGLEEETYEDSVEVDRVRYQDLSNQLRTHWRHLLDPELLRGMQNAYTNQRGVPNTINGQPVPHLAYPRIRGLQYVNAQLFPQFYSDDGDIFIGHQRGRGPRQDGVRPIREGNSQDRARIPVRQRRLRRERGPVETISMYEYLGTRNIRPPRGRENRLPR